MRVFTRGFDLVFFEETGRLTMLRPSRRDSKEMYSTNESWMSAPFRPRENKSSAPLRGTHVYRRSDEFDTSVPRLPYHPG